MGIRTGSIYIETRMRPQLSGRFDRIEIDCFPPLRFIAPGVQDTVVSAAKGHCELVADPPAQCAGLRESQVMGV
jgi:hypothetical protein